MNVLQLTLLIVYILWAINSLITIIKYPKALFQTGWDLYHDIRDNDHYNRKFSEREKGNELTPSANRFVFVTALGLIIAIILLTPWTQKVF